MNDTKIFAYARTAMKNLFHKPATTSYPFEPAHFGGPGSGHLDHQPVRLRAMRQLREPLSEKVFAPRARLYEARSAQDGGDVYAAPKGATCGWSAQKAR